MRKSAKRFTTSNRAAQRMYEHYYGWPRNMVSKYFHLHHTHGTIGDHLYINDPNSMILLPIAAHANLKKGTSVGAKTRFKKGHIVVNASGKGRIPIHKKRAKLIRLLNELDIMKVGLALKEELG